MHTPSHFASNDEAAAFEMVRERGFGLLITVVDGAPQVTHAPMLIDEERRVLQGHIARANEQSVSLDGQRCLAVFTGPNAYVSPNWYRDRSQVPTWNYLAVHISGGARVISAPAEIDALLSALAEHHEARRHDLADDRPWTMAKLPDEKLARLRRGIVAFEIAIETLTFKNKLSQNKSSEDIDAVADKLAIGEADQRKIAALMRAAKEAT